MSSPHGEALSFPWSAEIENPKGGDAENFMFLFTDPAACRFLINQRGVST